MDSNKSNIDRQKVTLALYFIKSNNNQELFGKWGIYIGKKYIIGRKNADINIDHQLISRNHLELTFYSNNLINIRDLGSRNGTYINNTKVNPYQEIKFSSKDKLSFGDINNKVVFLENQEQKQSIFEEKLKNENEDLNDQKVSQETKKIVSHNYDRRRVQYKYNRYGNRTFRNRRDYYYRYRFRPRSYHKNAYDAKPKTREVHSDYEYGSAPNNEFRNVEDKRNNLINNRYPNKDLKKENNLINDNKNEFIGKKVERNKSQSKNSDKIKKKKDLEKLIENKKIGLEKLKKKLKSIENDNEEDDYEENEREEDGEELDIFDLDNRKGNKKQIVFKSDKLNELEFVVPINERNSKDLKNVKKIKYLVNGYLVLNVKEKKLIYE